MVIFGYINKNDMEDKAKEYQRQYNKAYCQKKKAVKVFFDLKDYNAILKIASKEQKKVATFIREAVFAQARHVYLLPKTIEDEIKLGVRNMRSIGNNINQIARHANEQGYITPESLESVLQHLKKLEDEIKSLKNKI